MNIPVSARDEIALVHKKSDAIVAEEWLNTKRRGVGIDDEVPRPEESL